MTSAQANWKLKTLKITDIFKTVVKNKSIHIRPRTHQVNLISIMTQSFIVHSGHQNTTLALWVLRTSKFLILRRAKEAVMIYISLPQIFVIMTARLNLKDWREVSEWQSTKRSSRRYTAQRKVRRKALLQWSETLVCKVHQQHLKVRMMCFHPWINKKLRVITPAVRLKPNSRVIL